MTQSHLLCANERFILLFVQRFSIKHIRLKHKMTEILEMFCTFDLNQARSDRGNKANVTSCEELNSLLLMGSKCVLFNTIAWMYISGFIRNLKC